MSSPGNVWLLRHGETPWSLTGRHTGRTDVRLTPRGEQQAAALGQRISEASFAVVLTSPLARAYETCRIAGYEPVAKVVDDLQEWDYGAYEGLTTVEIQRERAGWSIWDDGAPGGEEPEHVAARAERAIARSTTVDGDVAMFAHGHLLRVLAARWLGWPVSAGGALALDTASVCVLGTDRGRRVVRHWNEICHLDGER